MAEIVINNRYGGFSVSRKALHRLRELGCEAALEETDVGEPYSDTGKIRENPMGDHFLSYGIERDDPFLVQVVKELGKEADGWLASLKVVEIPDDVSWVIEEYDGMEWVAEKHQTWG